MNARAVSLHGAGGQVQLAGYLDARVTKRDQPQDFDLARSQLILAERPVQGVQPCCHPWADVLLSLSGGANGLRQITVGEVLQDEPDRAGSERAPREYRAVVHR